MRLQAPFSSEYRAAPGTARPQVGRRWAGMRWLSGRPGSIRRTQCPARHCRPGPSRRTLATYRSPGGCLPVAEPRSGLQWLMARALRRSAGRNTCCLLTPSHHPARPALIPTAAYAVPARLARSRCTSPVSLVAAALAGPTQGLIGVEAGRLSCTGRLSAGPRGRWRWTGLPSRSNIERHNQPMANAAMTAVVSTIINCK